MDSQTSFSQLSQLSQDSLMPSTEVSRPNTPKMYSVSRSASPAPLNVPKASSEDRTKFTSPAPPTTSSMTPPPSSQLPNIRTAVLRTPSPPDPQLTSPPPTAKLPDQPSVLTESASALYSPEQITNASPDELRCMVDELTSALRDVRLSAAHYKLQYNMAVMESQEAASRMAVELAMAQREIDVLKQAEVKRRNSIPTPTQTVQESPVDSANAIMMSELNRQCQILQQDNEELRDALEQQKRLTEHREGELASLMEENDRLKTRIRKNRDHMAQFLPFQDQINEQGSPRSMFGTPLQATPRQRAQRVPQPLSVEHRGQSNFDILLRADQILNEKTTTAPSTPTRSHAHRSRLGHTRGTHSMSSLPHTPNRHTTHRHTGVPRTPNTFSAINIPQSAPPAQYQRVPPVRRESSNSTITASSVDEEEAFTDREDDEIPESQASQAATSMLRRSGSQKRASAPSSQAQLVQSKLFGHVKKGSTMSRPGESEKRRLPSTAMHHASPTKRGRMESEVGLGIGGLLRQ
ncbi:hypothetical protein BU24DRAFT_428638 [Aaosphaeria arxii CBS 175.79]|uniref:Uncharacterized protein n=1 Tax=Aaosphaeria arxii CBS 175.79 TaxID=1450172 RepID=A0A6A5X9X1_9PLEO|nr:uncharacterized protein BU24DRAFT_428638 [Aaosphaeria arxii CBS 175.79]KAF2009768.1 hypothetical protein BU24DRAFT_428638 [Aaosphaeria arxii CBS 175.79]